MNQADIRALAEALIATHLPGAGWSFSFDNAKRRAGLTDYRAKRIQLSRHLAASADRAEIEQVVLHEIAHALAGHTAAHGPVWRSTARAIGYRGARTHDHPIAEEHAPWLGECPAGHQHVRFRRPSRELSCGRCSRRFSRDALIRWQYRGTAAARRAAADRVTQSATRTSFQNAT